MPLAVFAASPAVGATGTDRADSSESEQLPDPIGDNPIGDLPGGLDPQALLDLEACLTELQGLVDDTAGEVPDPDLPDPGLPDPGVPPGDEADEQLPDPPIPGVPGDDGAGALPDLTELNKVCQTVLETVKGGAEVPDLPAPEVPADEPAETE